MIAKPAKTLISFNNNTPLVESNPGKPSESLKLRILAKSEHISPKLMNIIFLTPGGSGLERAITRGKVYSPHKTLVKILCKQSENFEGAVINYKVILSFRMRLQIVANHPLSPGLSSLWYLGFTLLCNLVAVLIPFLHDTLLLYVHLCYMYTNVICTLMLYVH